jgi:hypothetical protein
LNRAGFAFPKNKRDHPEESGQTRTYSLQKLIDENTIQEGISRKHDNAGKIITGGSLLLAVNHRMLS